MKLVLLGIIILSPLKLFAWEHQFGFKYKDSVNYVTLNFTDSSLKNCHEAVYEWQKKKGTLSKHKSLYNKQFVGGYPCDDMPGPVLSKLDQLTSFDSIVVNDRNDYLDLLMAFVNGIAYADDKKAWDVEDYIQTPFETLYFFQGDCEDHAFLLAQLMISRGYKIALIVYDDHAAIGVAEESLDYIPDEARYYVHDRVVYYYVEATRNRFCPTCDPWTIGVQPKKYHGISAVVFPLN